MNELSEDQREALRVEQTKRIQSWIEERVYDLADDIGSVGRGYNRLKNYSDLEVEAYASAFRDALESLGEREGCGAIPAFVQIYGALGERFHRQDLALGKRRHTLKRRLFDKLIVMIRNKRIAMLDNFESFEYSEFRPLQSRVWALERKGIEREEWDEFQLLQRELRALWELQSHLILSKHWTSENWKRRKAALTPDPSPLTPSPLETAA